MQRFKQSLRQLGAFLSSQSPSFLFDFFKRSSHIPTSESVLDYTLRARERLKWHSCSMPAFNPACRLMAVRPQNDRQTGWWDSNTEAIHSTAG